MWILPSRERPHNLQRLVEACGQSGASTLVEVCLDDDDPTLELSTAGLPDRWHVVVGMRGPLSALYNDALQRHPREDWYGVIADDVVPLTDAWDTRLIEVAGSDGMAVPAGGHDPNGAPHFVLGGDLVRSMGWLCLPGLDRLYIDTVWQNIAETRGVLRRVPEVVLEHRHFSNGKALPDQTYRKHHKARDKFIYDNWRHEYGYVS